MLRTVGAVLIGGLYSRSGSTLGAWVAMILGSGLALGSIALQQCWPALAPAVAEYVPDSAAQWLLARRERFPVNSQILAFAITLTGFASYFIVSYIDRKVHGTEYFNLEKMLHRGKYDLSGEHREVWSAGRIWRIFGLTDEFTRFDRLLFFASLLWTLLWTVAFVAGTLGHFVLGWQPLHWLRLWRGYVMLGFGLGIGTTIWFLIGGSADVVKLFRALRTRKRNDADDGRVVDGRNAGEEISAGGTETATGSSGD